MYGEKLRIVEALSEFDTAVGLEDIVAKAGMSRGKVLGNILKLCIEGLVAKKGRRGEVERPRYMVTKRGRVAIKEFKPVPEDKEFYFYLDENSYTGQVARSLTDFYEIINKIDAESLEFHVFRGDFENWAKDVLCDEDLAAEISGLKGTGVAGESLRKKISEIVGLKYRTMSVLLT
jgi:hypothetical protein